MAPSWTTLARLLLTLSLLQLTACGSDPANPGGTGSRLARQELRDSTGALTQYWTYEYDASGVSTVARGFNGTGSALTVATNTTVGGLRTQVAVTDGTGAPLYITVYSYVSGVLDRGTTTNASGLGDNYTVYVFAGGKKQTSTRYMTDGTPQGWNGFTYDAATGLRTGATFYDATDAVTGSSTRTYSGGLLLSDQLVRGAVTSFRTFTYQDGPQTIDPELFFEF